VTTRPFQDFSLAIDLMTEEDKHEKFYRDMEAIALRNPTIASLALLEPFGEPRTLPRGKFIFQAGNASSAHPYLARRNRSLRSAGRHGAQNALAAFVAFATENFVAVNQPRQWLQRIDWCSFVPIRGEDGAMQKITPFLWFDNQAEEAPKFYASIFKNSTLEQISRYSEEAAEKTGRSKGSVIT
jgi:hypothetical protein